MATEVEVLHADLLVARVAARQHGVVSRAQLVDAGLGRGAIAHRVATGRLHRIHRGVFLVGHPVAPPFAAEMAAVLACGPRAAVSHWSAAFLWALVRFAPDEVHVTVEDRHRANRPGIAIHRRRHLSARDVTRIHGIPVTGALMTVVDLAAVAPPRIVERAVEEAERRRLVRPADVTRLAAGRRGAATLARLADPGWTPTRSEAEERFLALLRRAVLPAPQLNAKVLGHEVDAVWPDRRLIVEIDGFEFHRSRAAFERDRRRDAALVEAGWRVVRVTWGDIADRPEQLVARLARLLAGTEG